MTNSQNIQRSDIHRPSLLDPSEYEFVAAFYQGTNAQMFDAYQADHEIYDTRVEWIHPDYRSKRTVGSARRDGEQVFTGNYAVKNTCDHCGANFAHGVLFLHVPTGDLIHVGHICANDTIGLPSRAAATRRTAEKAAAEEKARIARHEERKSWQEENDDVVSYLAQLPADAHHFLIEMKSSLHKWGSLFPKQADAVRKFIKSEQDRKDNPAPVEPEPTTPLIEGRREIKGTILSVKWQESMYGNTPKMLVREADGNKVWGTVAESVFSQGFDVSTAGLKGREVIFTGTVERSRDDEHFGFYKRPSGMKVTETEADAA